MSDEPASRTPLLVFADDWGRHPSSCQHLIRRLQGDCKILWANSIGTRQVRADKLTIRRAVEKVRSWAKGVNQVAEQMWVIDLPMLPGGGSRLIRNANRFLVTTRLRWVLGKLSMPRPFVLTTLPYVAGLIRDLPRRGLIYYCTDDYSHWPSADRETLQQAERQLAGEADLILGASRALSDRHAWTGRSRYFPHGVDFPLFSSVQHGPEVSPAVARLSGPRIGFFGLIYEKLDFPLLMALARAFPEASLVLIGPVAYCPPDFAQLPNVHLLGQQPYQELPRYIAGLDVLLLPYLAQDEMIRQSGPLKLRECLASGKPTVSVDVPEVRALQPHVRIGTDREDFVRQVRLALEERSDPSLALARQAAVAEDGWDRRAAELRSLMGEIKATRGPRTGPDARPPSVPRVLHLRTVAGRGGGPEKTLLNSPRFLRGAYEVRLAYLRPQEDPGYDMPARATQMGVSFVDVPERGPVDPWALWRLARAVWSFRPHILHPHDYKTNVVGLVFARMLGIPVVTTLHGYVTRGGRLEAYYLIDRWAIRCMDHAIAVSTDLYEFLGKIGVPHARRSLVENAIDSEQYVRRHLSAEAKKCFGLDPGRPVVGAVGRLSPEKGFGILIQAVARLRNAGHDIDLLIVGEGEERTCLEALIRKLGVGGHVQLLGHRSDTRDLYEVMDIFALSSLREGLPNVILEAMSMEVPVVATRVAGLPRVIQDGENGLLVPAADEDELVQALARLLGDESLRTRLAQAARQTVEIRFGFETRMRKIRTLYDRLLIR